MKKTSVVLAIWFTVSMVAHADVLQRPVQQAPVLNDMSSASQPVAIEEQTSVNNDADKMGVGSGDDVDTIDEADPANDKDPEADDTSNPPNKS